MIESLGEAGVSDTLWTALLALQGEAIHIQKNAEAAIESKTGRSYKFKYATLAKVHSVVLPRLDHYKLLWLTEPTGTTLKYRLRHIPSDQEIGGEIEFPQAVTPQSYGAWVSYLRRYALMSVLNLVPTETDNDAQPRVERAASDRKLTQAQTAKIVEAITSAEPMIPNFDLFLTAAGVSTNRDDWTQATAFKIRQALDARKTNAES
jgi:hypothetical protein